MSQSLDEHISQIRNDREAWLGRSTPAAVLTQIEALTGMERQVKCLIDEVTAAQRQIAALILEVEWLRNSKEVSRTGD